MNDELSLVTETGTAALVAAMATDLWQEIRDAVTAPFRRTGDARPPTAEHRPDDTPPALRQTNTARDGASVFAVQQGTQHVHGRG
ncbi:hypothetical protein AB0G32_22675 [Streptomyces sp. NPDC023723]|uniref:hypothetical protein n=1 Tax=Streptomyces sp. NPDC023723 TaxID=3154323 RepID=UPI0033C45A1E